MEVHYRRKGKNDYLRQMFYKSLLGIDLVTAGNGEKEDHPLGKGSHGVVCSSIIFDEISPDSTSQLMDINMVSANKMICNKVSIVPLEVI